MRGKTRSYYMDFDGNSVLLKEAHSDPKARKIAKEYAKQHGIDSSYQLFSISPINSNTRYIDI